MIQPPNANDVMTPEEFAAIRDLHDRRLEEVHEQLRMTSVHDAAMALNLSEDEVRLYLANVRSQPTPEVKPKRSRAGLLIAAVMMLGLASCIAVGLLIQRALVAEPARARTFEAPTAPSGYEPAFPTPMAEATVLESGVTMAAPEASVGAPVISDAAAPSPQPSDDPGTAMPPQQEPSSVGAPTDDGSGYPDAQYEKYSNAPADLLPTSPDGQ